MAFTEKFYILVKCVLLLSTTGLCTDSTSTPSSSEHDVSEKAFDALVVNVTSYPNSESNVVTPLDEFHISQGIVDAVNNTTEIAQDHNQEIDDLVQIDKIEKHTGKELFDFIDADLWADEFAEDDVYILVPKSETELIENGENTEDKRLNDEVEMVVRRHELPIGSSLLRSELAAVLAAMFILTIMLASLGTLIWRRYYQRQYNNRQLLINEDMKYFTL